jgi:hypothetical protein
MDVAHRSYSAIKIRVADPPSTAGVPVLERVRGECLRDPLQHDPYGRSVRDVLNVIAQQVTGQIILEAIQGSGNLMTIQLYTPTAQGQQTLPCGGPDVGQPVQEGIICGTPVEGMGRGRASIISFTPSMWTNPGAGPGGSADQILLHEMLHGYRQLRGRMLSTAGGMGNYDTFEEYFAIVITNMYLSEATGSSTTPLRAHYDGSTTLPYPQLFPDSQENRRHLLRIHRENSELTGRLAFRSRGPFNPFRDLFLQTVPLPDRRAVTATA